MTTIEQHRPCRRAGNLIRLRSGKYLDLRDPKPDQFAFSDIAGGLSKICRFGGQTNSFYSVAEHSYHCSNVAEEDGMSVELQIAVLMHDAAEAFIGDCVRPLKSMLQDYRDVETKVETAIAERFGISLAAPEIWEIDNAMLLAERRHFFSFMEEAWHGEEELRVLAVPFHLWMPCHAEFCFTKRARELGIDIQE